ncbi:STAS domain-containing protein [Actinospica sp.]|jgi:anti-anti-sigma regulatory factor|uniref:STAS domain-containing protein n=1 Tax=Actinospica sp. TaxID=1872142 RepID=UPI002C15CC4A|nr:STAS domain-containing protein [Actinospica sp.]HWG26129.1 STAS domain-containing protein [Actinospica sp.]
MTVVDPHNATTAAPASDQGYRATPLGTSAAIVVTFERCCAATAVVTGELDLACADDLVAAMCSTLDGQVSGLQIDLAGVEFFDCAALHALERVQEYAERRGCRVSLERWSVSVELVLALAEPSGWARPGPRIAGHGGGGAFEGPEFAG